MPRSSSPSGSAAGPYPVTYTFAALVIIALAGLVIMRHLTGTISVT